MARRMALIHAGLRRCPAEPPSRICHELASQPKSAPQPTAQVVPAAWTKLPRTAREMYAAGAISACTPARVHVARVSEQVWQEVAVRALDRDSWRVCSSPLPVGRRRSRGGVARVGVVS